jgi:hypothetical protein
MIVQGAIGLVTGILLLVVGAILLDLRLILLGVAFMVPSAFVTWWFIKGRPFS